METAFSRFSGFSDGGTAVDAGAGGIGFFSVLASETGGSIAGAVEEAMLFPVADCFSWISDWGKTFDCITSLFEGSGGFAGGTFGETVVWEISFAVFSPGGTEEDTESKDDRYRSADAGRFLFFLGEEASSDFGRNDAEGELALSDFIGFFSREAFGVVTAAGGETGEACWAGGDTAGWLPVSFCSSVNRLSVDPGPSPTSILEKSFICDLVEAHPPPKTKAPATTRTVQATAHMAFTIPPCKRLILKKEITNLARLSSTPGSVHTP